jgi:signal transduction histidine kinase
VLLSLLPVLLAVAQPTNHFSIEEGRPFFVTPFTPETYQGYHQNWAVVQDKRGVTYVANRDGVLEYDGRTWRLIRTPLGTTVRALAVDTQGTVYVGQQGDFGYLKPDSLGNLAFASLTEHVPAHQRGFTDVWTILPTPEGVYFHTTNRLFRWDGTQIQSWEHAEGFHTAFVVRGRLYIRVKDVGLMTMQDDTLRLVSEGARFAEIRIFVMLPYGDREILLVTREAGLFRYDGQRFHPFATDADAYLKRYYPYHGVLLANNFYALATIGGGVVVLTSEGQVVRVLDQESGLADSIVNFLYADPQGGLWMALNSNGIMRVDLPTPLTVYERSEGLMGAVYAMTRYQEQIYVATANGVFVLEPYVPLQGEQPQHPRFTALSKDLQRAWDLTVVGDFLYMATDRGLYRYHKGEIAQITEDQTFALLASKVYPGLLYVGTKKGLRLLQQQATRVESLGTLWEADKEIRSMVELADGTLWAATRHQGLLELRFNRGLGLEPAVRHFTEKHGLVKLNNLAVTQVAGAPLFFSEEGVYRFRETSAARPARFEAETTLFSGDMQPTTLQMLREDAQGRVWLVYRDRIVVATPEGNGYRYAEPPALRFFRSSNSMLHLEANGRVWFDNGDLLFRYDPGLQKAYDQPFPTFIRRVSTVDQQRLIFGGTFASPQGLPAAEQQPADRPVLPFSQRDLLFEFAAPNVNGVGETQYQYWMEGASSEWSSWMTAPQQTFPNLDEGLYRLHVRARNGQGVVGQEIVFAFQILPPWYRTWWAYVLYVLCGISFVVFAWKYTRMVKAQRLAARQALELQRERVLNERLQEANTRLQEANEHLQQADRLKDEFLATTSHELRTPLTAILGYTAILKEEITADAPHREFLDMIEESGVRLTQTLTEFIDLARLRAGTVQVYMERHALDTLSTDAVVRFLGRAHRKQLSLEIVKPPIPIYALVDENIFGRVLDHLIGNALKFTDTGGVVVVVQADDTQVYVEVRDTGVGIDAQFLPHLFEPFFQGSQGLTRAHRGNGLGLANTAQFVGLMSGQISVQSTKGEGSVFTLTFRRFVESERLSGLEAGGDGIPAVSQLF